MTPPARNATLAVAAAAGFLELGALVSPHPPGALDRAGAVLAGVAPHVAYIFTASCFFPALVGLGLVAIAVAIRYPAWRARVAFSVFVTLVAWPISDDFKNLFMRERPPYWHLIHETSYSYASGHAMFAVLVYGLWSFYFAKSALGERVRSVLAALFAAWMLGVMWSRLALGAHYITDLIGGMLLAIAILGTTLLVADAPAAARRRRSTAVPERGDPLRIL